MTCAVCRLAQCTLCGCYPHAGESCAESAERRAREGSPEAQAARHALTIRQDMMVPTCPGCKLTFVDFDACFALHCPLCHTGLCGFCLFNTRQEDPHVHVARYKN